MKRTAVFWLRKPEDVRDILNPPETRCLSLEGYLVIAGSNGATLASLEGLKNLYSVERDLSMLSSAYLEDLQGLENLSRVGRSLSISSNTQLQSLFGLSRLARVVGHLNISHNDQLRTIEGMESLQRVE